MGATKWELAQREIDDLAGSEQVGMVLGYAGKGMNAMFRRALTVRGLRWSVGTVRTQRVYPAHVHVHLLPIPKHVRGRRQKYPTPSEDAESIEIVQSRALWRRMMRRLGTKVPLMGTFAAKYVRVAYGNENTRGHHLPGKEPR